MHHNPFTSPLPSLFGFQMSCPRFRFRRMSICDSFRSFSVPISVFARSPSSSCLPCSGLPNPPSYMCFSHSVYFSCAPFICLPLRLSLIVVYHEHGSYVLHMHLYNADVACPGTRVRFDFTCCACIEIRLRVVHGARQVNWGQFRLDNCHWIDSSR